MSATSARSAEPAAAGERMVGESTPTMSAPRSRSAPAGSSAPLPRKRTRALVIVCALALLFALDLARPAPQQLSARGLVGAIHLYQATLSPRLGALGVRCRFKPTCSHYAEGAILKHGALVGSARAAWRVLRCGPWTPKGTFDPP